ncbi:MAG: protein-L-isoaspartate(D-aspartate) O-methyltransferase [Rhizobiaceae bacterium]
MNSMPDEREGFASFLLRMRALGINNRDLFAAVEATPRRSFVPAQWQHAVWSVGMIPIECGEALEGIDLQARALAALDPAPGQRVLEIGAGSGFTSAVLGRMAGRILSVERFRTLAGLATQRLEALSLSNVVVRHADGSKGMPADGPFDRIIVWAAFDAYPRAFVDMLSTGGVMVAPIGPAEGAQVLVRLSKVGSRFEREDIAEVRLQPLVSGMAEII